jgi:hypothetical protein
MARNGRRGDRDRRPALERAPADAPDRVQHDRDHHGLRPSNTAATHDTSRPAAAIHDSPSITSAPGITNSAPADDAPPDAVQPPADVGGELLRLGSRQQRAEIERAQERALADPAPPVDQLVLHDRDLAGGSAEGDAAELEPEAQRLAEGGAPRAGFENVVERHGAQAFGGQPCVSPCSERHQL